jgi:hypothetical protein
LREVLSSAIKHSGKSRAQIAAELSDALGRAVTVSMLNDFTSVSGYKEGARFPAAWIIAFCVAVGDDSLQRLVLSPRLRKVLELAERDLAAIRDEMAREELRDRLLDETDSEPEVPGA